MSMNIMVTRGFELLFVHSGMIVQQKFLFPKHWVQNSANVWIYFGLTLIQCEKIHIIHPSTVYLQQF